MFLIIIYQSKIYFYFFVSGGGSSLLVLTRSLEEKLIIGDSGEITITIIDVQGNKVRLGIDAPRHVSVHREEIYHRIQEAVD